MKPIDDAVHPCVDMQLIFAKGGIWETPWMERVLPTIVDISARHAARTVFTRFTGPQGPPQGEQGTGIVSERSPQATISDVVMTESLPLLIESSIEIAWDYLERTGELGDADVACRFLAETIELMARRGESRRLMLANKAITAYQQFRRQQAAHHVLASA